MPLIFVLLQPFGLILSLCLTSRPTPSIRRYQSHAGFLAEAFVEAIPQGLLQIAAIQATGEASAVTVVSVLISVVVVASKGYFISFSIHRPTFIFNLLCVAADCFNVFASISWFFFGTVDNGVNRAWLFLTLMALSSSLFCGVSLIWFTILDDHLKSRISRDFHAAWKVIWYEIYFVRLFAWVLGVIPVTVVVLSFKLSIFPVFVFRSLDPEYAIYADFYTPLFNFLLGIEDADAVDPLLMSAQDPVTTLSFAGVELTNLTSEQGSSCVNEPLPIRCSQVLPRTGESFSIDDAAMLQHLRLQAVNAFISQARRYVKQLPNFKSVPQPSFQHFLSEETLDARESVLAQRREV